MVTILHSHQQCRRVPGAPRPCRHLVRVVFVLVYLFIFNVYLFWERASTCQGGAEREGERIPARLHTVRVEPDAGLELMNHEIMTWAETKSGTLNRLSHPGVPRSYRILIQNNKDTPQPLFSVYINIWQFSFTLTLSFIATILFKCSFLSSVDMT